MDYPLKQLSPIEIEYARQDANLVYPFHDQADGTPEDLLVFVYSHHLSREEFMSEYPSANCLGVAWLDWWQFHINEFGEPNLRPVPHEEDFLCGAAGYACWMSREEEQRYQASFVGPLRKRRLEWITVRHDPIVYPAVARPQPYWSTIWPAVFYWDSDNIDSWNLESIHYYGTHQISLWWRGWCELKDYCTSRGWDVEDGTFLDLDQDVQKMYRNILYNGQRPGEPYPEPPSLIPDIIAHAAETILVNVPGAPLLTMSMIQGGPDRPWGYRKTIDDNLRGDEPNNVNPGAANPGAAKS